MAQELRITFAAMLLWLALPLGAAQGAELLMVEQPGCTYCEQWNHDISEVYPKTPEGKAAPLRRMQLSDTRGESGVEFARPVVFTPTFVLIEEGRELARIEGYPGEDFFWGLLGMMLESQLCFTPVTP